MFRIFLTICCFLFACEASFAQEKKIDVESLGLDDVEKKEENVGKIVADKFKGAIGKIQKIFDKQDVKPAAEKEEKSKTEKYVNSTKKNNLKKRLEAEKRRANLQKQEKEKSQKLAELRKKYLSKNDEELELDDEEKIIPQRKEINKFNSEELPAPPILNSFRTQDNLHIPQVPTWQDNLVLLFASIRKGDILTFNEAYKKVENPDARNSFGDTILAVALLLQKQPIIASVLAKGADPNLPNGLGYNPITIAIEMLDIKALELLVENGADVNYVDAFGRTYLMHAARLGFLPAVDLFVTKGLDVNQMDKDGFTALSIAYRHKKEVIVQYLLKHGAQTWIEKTYEPEKQSLIKELENRWR